MVDLNRSPEYHENQKRFMCRSDRDELPCCVCGRRVDMAKPSTKVLHLHNGGGHVVTEAEAAKLDPAADVGCHPIGPDCLRAHPELRPYAQ